MIFAATALLAANAVTGAFAAYTPEALADQVKSLPGLTDEISFNHFSGYLPISETKRMHYWFAESEQDPANAPVAFW